MPGSTSASGGADGPAAPAVPARPGVPASAPRVTAREWLALPGGGIRRVVTVEDELLAHAAFVARPTDPCACGRPRLGSGRSCGSAACVARLHQAG